MNQAELAKIGARVRLAELAEEQKAIEAFLEGTPSAKPKKRQLSTAARKAIGQRMKAYWAKRREGNKKPRVSR